jgi:Clostridium epsilon toxin ETX/Bacillus mosquitocidal toxin MTX2
MSYDDEVRNFEEMDKMDKRNETHVSKAVTMVDFEEHLRTYFIEQMMRGAVCEEYDEVRIEKVEWDEVSFRSRIDYKLDQFTVTENYDSIDRLYQSNGTSLTTTMSINRHETRTDTYSWTNEASFSVGITVSASVKVPFVGGIDTSVETSVSLSKSETHTEEISRGWSWTNEIPVAPGKKVTAVLRLARTKPRVPYVMTVEMNGQPRIYWRAYLKGQYVFSSTQRESLVNLLTFKPLANFIVPAIGDPDRGLVYFKTEGVFTANEGLIAETDLTETPVMSEGQVLRKWIRPGVEKPEVNSIRWVAYKSVHVQDWKSAYRPSWCDAIPISVPPE